MRDLIPFQFNGHDVPAIRDDNGDPWWKATDVCEQCAIKNVSKACERLDADEKAVVTLSDTAGRPQDMLIVNEAGLYALVLSSRKAAARTFKRWVTHDVIPQIRKTGQYTATHDGLPTNRGDLLVQMAEAYRLQERRLLAVEAAQQEDQRQRLEHQAALIASQAQAIEALQQSTRAETKADHALHGQEWVTLRQYVCIHTLEHQFPPSDQHAFGTWLSGYCLQNNIPVYEIRPADRAYAKENQYHAGTIALTLPGWLVRRHGQSNLIHFPEQGA